MLRKMAKFAFFVVVLLATLGTAAASAKAHAFQIAMEVAQEGKHHSRSRRHVVVDKSMEKKEGGRTDSLMELTQEKTMAMDSKAAGPTSPIHGGADGTDGGILSAFSVAGAAVDFGQAIASGDKTSIVTSGVALTLEVVCAVIAAATAATPGGQIAAVVCGAVLLLWKLVGWFIANTPDNSAVVGEAFGEMVLTLKETKNIFMEIGQSCSKTVNELGWGESTKDAFQSLDTELKKAREYLTSNVEPKFTLQTTTGSTKTVDEAEAIPKVRAYLQEENNKFAGDETGPPREWEVHMETELMMFDRMAASTGVPQVWRSTEIKNYLTAPKQGLWGLSGKQKKHHDELFTSEDMDDFSKNMKRHMGSVRDYVFGVEMYKNVLALGEIGKDTFAATMTGNHMMQQIMGVVLDNNRLLVEAEYSRKHIIKLVGMLESKFDGEVNKPKTECMIKFFGPLDGKTKASGMPVIQVLNDLANAAPDSFAKWFHGCSEYFWDAPLGSQATALHSLMALPNIFKDQRGTNQVRIFPSSASCLPPASCLLPPAPLFGAPLHPPHRVSQRVLAIETSAYV